MNASLFSNRFRLAVLLTVATLLAFLAPATILAQDAADETATEKEAMPDEDLSFFATT